MPTGYTCHLYDGEQSFPEYAMTCARAFGACIEMRDDPLDKPIPEKFEPSDYHAKGLAKGQNDLRFWQNATEDEVTAARLGEFDKLQASHMKRIAECAARLARYQKMKAEVQAWQPPTDEHTGLKEFMLQQLETSMSDCTTYTTAPTETSNEDYRAEKIRRAESDIDYHTKEMAKDEERAKGRTDWVQALRDSLRTPGQQAA